MNLRLLSFAIVAAALSGGALRAAAQFGPQIPSMPQGVDLRPSIPENQLRAAQPNAAIPQIPQSAEAQAARPAAIAQLPPAVLARPAYAAPPLGPTYAAGRGTGGEGVTPCQDLLEKAARLISAGRACENDIRRGVPHCEVVVNFYSPHMPREVAWGFAYGRARAFQEVGERGDQEACRDFGGEGYIGEGTDRRARSYYGSLCQQGDNYACRAEQMTRLCFDHSPVNQCTRDCLVQFDIDNCQNLGPDDKLACRKRAHWSCYEGGCKKTAIGPEEFRCISQFAGWYRFMIPPTR